MRYLLPLLCRKRIIGTSCTVRDNSLNCFCSLVGGFQLQYDYLCMLLQPSKEITLVMLEVACIIFYPLFLPSFLGTVRKFCIKKLVEKPQFTDAAHPRHFSAHLLRLLSGCVFFWLLLVFAVLLLVTDLHSARWHPIVREGELPEETHITHKIRCYMHIGTDKQLHSTFFPSTQ